MPGGQSGPHRSRRLWSFSADRLRYASDGGVAAWPFGLLFTTSGSLCFVALVDGVLDAVGLPMLICHKPAVAPAIALNIWNLAGGIICISIIGGGHLACGTMLLWFRRVTIDRKLGIVVIRSGWLGFVRRVFALADFDHVQVKQGENRWPFLTGSAVYDIELVGSSKCPLAIGYATDSLELANELADEVRDFLQIA